MKTAAKMTENRAAIKPGSETKQYDSFNYSRFKTFMTYYYDNDSDNMK